MSSGTSGTGAGAVRAARTRARTPGWRRSVTAARPGGVAPLEDEAAAQARPERQVVRPGHREEELRRGAPTAGRRSRSPAAPRASAGWRAPGRRRRPRRRAGAGRRRGRPPSRAEARPFHGPWTRPWTTSSKTSTLARQADHPGGLPLPEEEAAEERQAAPEVEVPGVGGGGAAARQGVVARRRRQREAGAVPGGSPVDVEVDAAEGEAGAQGADGEGVAQPGVGEQAAPGPPGPAPAGGDPEVLGGAGLGEGGEEEAGRARRPSRPPDGAAGRCGSRGRAGRRGALGGAGRGGARGAGRRRGRPGGAVQASPAAGAAPGRGTPTCSPCAAMRARASAACGLLGKPVDDLLPGRRRLGRCRSCGWRQTTPMLKRLWAWRGSTFWACSKLASALS